MEITDCAHMSAVPSSRREQAIAHAALNVAERAASTGWTLETASREFVHGKDPHQPGSVNSAGQEITFTWSYGYDDIPDIIARARTYEQENDNG